MPRTRCACVLTPERDHQCHERRRDLRDGTGVREKIGWSVRSVALRDENRATRLWGGNAVGKQEVGLPRFHLSIGLGYISPLQISGDGRAAGGPNVVVDRFAWRISHGNRRVDCALDGNDRVVTRDEERIPVLEGKI